MPDSGTDAEYRRKDAATEPVSIPAARDGVKLFLAPGTTKRFGAPVKPFLWIGEGGLKPRCDIEDP